ncbi:tubulin-tyrosine ligase family protein, putative [Ichthyophthirius multifiliis]|uniref:Tubulin-tyrosine ligase family protein, putative n=1 Tax=Ichthyophthirius multifiliis TaxID=5932 RepID=G0QWE1_ICHMU|nr:tubulin-tyrosine ligase family protein, putative [Ichthyophthirius multifiliis]EGR30458.1 tubulin-tyrosine ligase family protein, putative [Ichthyophthirius multifiliis]|eukprot:XP_004032045.1 tubulin-tyrosine ligase family protein, putative [Ichthyophthirius multifiliis]
MEDKYLNFYKFHGIQLDGALFPKQLINQLYDILVQQKFDFSEYFQVQENQEESTFQAVAVKDIHKNSKVFLLFLSIYFLKYLRYFQSNINQLSDLKNQDKFQKKIANQNKIQQILHNQMQLIKLFIFQYKYIKKKIPQDVISLSLFDNKIESLDLVRETLKKLKNLKALFLNYNPVSELEGFFEIISTEFPNIEVLNSKLTQNATDFGLKFCSYNYNLDKSLKIKTEMVKKLNLKKRNLFNLNNFDVFLQFKNLQSIDLTQNERISKEKIKVLLEKCPKLENLNIDFEIELQIWEKGETLNLKSINDRDLKYQKPLENEPKIVFIIKNIWKQVGNYRLYSSKQIDQSSVWYLNDLCGISIQHSDIDNVRLIPFLFAPNNEMDDKMISYSVLWVSENIKSGDQIYRDYLFGINEKKQRSSRLTAFFKVPENYFMKRYQEYKNLLMQNSIQGRKLIKSFSNQNIQKKNLVDQNKVYKVVTDSNLVAEFLTLKNFEITKEIEGCDIIFLTQDFEKAFMSFSNSYLVNQFPYESCIVSKQNLADTVNSVLGEVPWLQTTYNLETQLSEFIGEYRRREIQSEDNIWILKPFNLARSLDMVVTDNLDCIIRQMETIPRVAQKYIENPVTLFNRKIDLRYVVAVRSIAPLEIFLYKVFWIRISNNEFTNDYRSREIYETHFTVMNYGKKLQQIHYDEFIQLFEVENPEVKWQSVHDKIKVLVKELFIAVASKYPQMQSDKVYMLFFKQLFFYFSIVQSCIWNGCYD